MPRLIAAGLIALLVPLHSHATEPAATPPAAQVRIDDVQRFYQLYDRTDGHPAANRLQSDYLDQGSPGLKQFVHSRIGSADKLAAAIDKAPDAYLDARACAATLSAVRQQLGDVFSRLAAIHPQAVFPPVTVVIGRNTTGGTTTASGVIIGLETICRANWMEPDITARLTHLIAHEYVHLQQPAARIDPPPEASVLFLSLIEGGAEFIGEQISGQVANIHLQRWTQGHECTIERRFLAEADGTDVTPWLYNGPGTPEQPGDLGYWVGYRIAKSYYEQAVDKQQAVAEILAINNDTAADFLAKSGWKPAGGCTALP